MLDITDCSAVLVLISNEVSFCKYAGKVLGWYAGHKLSPLPLLSRKCGLVQKIQAEMNELHIGRVIQDSAVAAQASTAHLPVRSW